MKTHPGITSVQLESWNELWRKLLLPDDEELIVSGHHLSQSDIQKNHISFGEEALGNG